MPSGKEYKEYIAGQLARAAGGERIVFKPMMGEFLAYCDGVYFGGIFDDRFLVKITPTNEKYAMQKEIPYDGAKPMYMPTDPDDAETLCAIVEDTCAGLLAAKRSGRTKETQIRG